MARSTECQTDGGIYTTVVEPRKVSISVELPFELKLNAADNEILRRNMHNVMEIVLARYWPPSKE